MKTVTVTMGNQTYEIDSVRIRSLEAVVRADEACAFSIPCIYPPSAYLEGATSGRGVTTISDKLGNHELVAKNKTMRSVLAQMVMKESMGAKDLGALDKSF